MKQPYSKQMRALARKFRSNSTSQESILWRQLRDRRLGVKFRRQVTIGNKYIVDFVCLEKHLIVEIDGSQHAEKKTDIIRTRYLEQCGFRVLRFWNNEINKNLQACLDLIFYYCNMETKEK